MADLGQPVMRAVSHEVHSDAVDRGHEFLRISVARALRAESRAREAEKSKAVLEHAVEFEIVPRLVLAHQTQTPKPAESAASSRTGFPQEIKAFAELVLGRSEDAAGAHIQSLRQQGVPLEAIYINLLSPTARYLKYQWLEDERDFADVTLGLWRLQQLLRQFSAEFRSQGQNASGLRALLAPGPSEPHDLGYLMFGLVMLGEFFRRGGWDAWVEPAPKAPELAETIHNEWFDVVEFMVSGQKRLDELAATIKLVRKASLNQSLGVLVCGQMFVEHPELVLLVGGDIPAADPRDAADQAQSLVRAIAQRE
jgi:hypothetical protein